MKAEAGGVVASSWSAEGHIYRDGFVRGDPLLGV